MGMYLNDSEEELIRLFTDALFKLDIETWSGVDLGYRIIYYIYQQRRY